MPGAGGTSWAVLGSILLDTLGFRLVVRAGRRRYAPDHGSARANPVEPPPHVRILVPVLCALPAWLAACASIPSVEEAGFGREDAWSTSLSTVERPTPLGLPASLAAEQAPGMLDREEHALAPLGEPFWPAGHTVMQGFFGADIFDTIETSGGTTPAVDGSGEGLSQLPAIGGGAQWKLSGERVDFGFEGMISFGWRADATAIAVGGGGALIAVDVDLLLIDLYGGPFLSVFLGDRWRAYVAGGPMMQWAEWDQSDDTLDEDSSGFGTGFYARGGLELRVMPGVMVGAGVRWMDSTIDLGSDLGDLDLQGFQYAVTVSHGI